MTVLTFSPPAFADDLTLQLDALVAAYPDHLARHDGVSLFWRDGTAMKVGGDAPARPLQEMLRDASIRDQLRITYPRGKLSQPPARDEDPGRVRNTAFFKKMYGDCSKNEVTRRTVEIKWMPKSWGKTVRVTSVNGIADKLRAVSAELDELPAAIRQAAFPIAGVYNCRNVADTGQPSVHAFAAAIDLNTQYADYWFWQKARDPIPYRNKMPYEIRRDFREARLHLGRQMVSLRYDAL